MLGGQGHAVRLGVLAVKRQHPAKRGHGCWFLIIRRNGAVGKECGLVGVTCQENGDFRGHGKDHRVIRGQPDRLFGETDSLGHAVRIGFAKFDHLIQPDHAAPGQSQPTQVTVHGTAQQIVGLNQTGPVIFITPLNRLLDRGHRGQADHGRHGISSGLRHLIDRACHFGRGPQVRQSRHNRQAPGPDDPAIGRACHPQQEKGHVTIVQTFQFDLHGRLAVLLNGLCAILDFGRIQIDQLTPFGRARCRGPRVDVSGAASR